MEAANTSDSKINPGPTEKNSIQAIDRGTVHRICSGQVIINLATAVKELVENSVDSGATNVEIRLKDHGTELIEVVDNGSGVLPQDFQGLALKHHTSKLKEFSDLCGVETFGFRGEALSSLCAVSNVTITTRHKECNVGTKLVFDHNGVLTLESPCHRDIGTTVSVQQLFHTLPVRHKELLRNAKKEYSKLYQILQAYGIINLGVRMTCTNQVGKGKKNIVLSTPGNHSMKDNIVSIFGAKQFSQLVPFNQLLISDEAVEEFGLKKEVAETPIPPFTVDGYVSSACHGSGRSCADRQFFFINKRPCDVARLSRLVNEVYHSYNRHQYPFVSLTISSKADAVDVNVTPDKRQVLIHQEKMLLAVIKTSLKSMFELNASSYELSPITTSVKSFSSDSSNGFTSICSKLEGSKELPVGNKECTRTSSAEEEVTEIAIADQCENIAMPKQIGGYEACVAEPSPKQNLAVSVDSHGTTTGDNGSVDQLCSNVFQKLITESRSNFKAYTPTKNRSPMKQSKLMDSFKRIGSSSSRTPTPGKPINHIGRSLHSGASIHKGPSSSEPPSVCRGGMMIGRRQEEEVKQCPIVDGVSQNSTGPNKRAKLDDEVIAVDSDVDDEISAQTVAPFDDKAIDWRRRRPSKSIPFNLEKLRRSIFTKDGSTSNDPGSFQASFNARISPDQNQDAESELRCQISKYMFSKMAIIGQFNLGFIITKLGKDLFIIDQHATDEKYNFETLQKQHSVQGQKLIAPRLLELTAVNESILMENLSIFQRNGFEFEVNEDAEVGKRVKLTSVPVSKNWTFGIEDVEELIFMLSDSPGVLCRPSRVRQMFASRACRSSVMVGKALTMSQMKKLVMHMGEIEQPWNCPHGRPTMRHLVNTGRIIVLPKASVGSK